MSGPFRIIKRKGGSGYTITDATGRPWAVASPNPKGSLGVAHTLRYPDLSSIRRTDPDGTTRGLVTIDSYPRRLHLAKGAEVPRQEVAIMATFMDAKASGWIKDPDLRQQEKDAAAEKRNAAERERNEQHARIERGLMNLAARGLEPDELYALQSLAGELGYSYCLAGAKP